MFVTFIIISHLFKFDHYRDTRAFILDPCIQGILIVHKRSKIMELVISMYTSIIGLLLTFISSQVIVAMLQSYMIKSELVQKI